MESGNQPWKAEAQHHIYGVATQHIDDGGTCAVAVIPIVMSVMDSCHQLTKSGIEVPIVMSVMAVIESLISATQPNISPVPMMHAVRTRK